MDTVQARKAAEVELAKAKLAQEKAQLALDYAKSLEEIEAKEKALADGNVPAPQVVAAATVKRRPGRPPSKAVNADSSDANAVDATSSDDGEKKDKRLKNGVTWRQMILSILNDNKQGLKIDDILAQVNAKGFKTDGNIRQMVYHTLYRLWKTEKVVDRSENDVYQVKEAVAA